MLPGGGFGDSPCGPDCALHTHPQPRPELHRTPERSSAAPKSTAPIPPPPLKHCWVTTDHGPVPALHKEWGCPGPAWEWLALVLMPVLIDDGWDLQERWVPADQVRPHA